MLPLAMKMLCHRRQKIEKSKNCCHIWRRMRHIQLVGTQGMRSASKTLISAVQSWTPYQMMRTMISCSWRYSGTTAECLRDRLCLSHSKTMNQAWICHELPCLYRDWAFVREGCYHHTLHGL